jgi:hypothetical protein
VDSGEPAGCEPAFDLSLAEPKREQLGMLDDAVLPSKQHAKPG